MLRITPYLLTITLCTTPLLATQTPESAWRDYIETKREKDLVGLAKRTYAVEQKT